MQKKSRKGQNTEVIKFNSRQLIHCLKIENAALKWTTWVNSKTDGSPRSWPCSHAMSTLDHWFETQVLRYVSVSFLYWTRSHDHLRECYRHGYYFFGFTFLETRSCRLQDPLMIFECLRFIRNLSHGVRSLVTFIKTYLEYNQLRLQTLDITEFCMSQCKLNRCILFLYKNHD